jgi:hypothetical protein
MGANKCSLFLLQTLHTMRALLSAPFLIMSVVFALIWFFRITTFSDGVISIALFPPQLSQPCEVYTRTQLGDIAVHKTFPIQAYVENARLKNAIEEAMLDEPRVWVLYAPTHAGKSTAVTHVLHHLHQQGKVSVLKLHGGWFADYFDSLDEGKQLISLHWLQHAMKCVKPFSSFAVGDIFPEKHEPTQPLSVILIDQFEAITNRVSNIKKVQWMMHDVAVDIPVLMNYAVLATTSNLETYLEMLTWNGGKKFTAVVEGGFIWTQEELQSVVDTYQRKGFISPATASPASMAVLHDVMKNMTTINELRLYLSDHKLVKFTTPVSKPVEGEL